MEDDDESWRDIDPHPLFPADTFHPKVKRVKVESDIKVEPEVELEPDLKVQDVTAERAPEASSPPSSEVSCPPSPDASGPPSPTASCSSPPEVSCPSSPEGSRVSSPEPPEVQVEEAEDDATPEASRHSSLESSCPPSPEPTETTTEVTDPPECPCCKETAVLKYTSFLNDYNADRLYFVCPHIERWVCWADQKGIDAANPRCYCKGEARAPSRLDIIIRNKTKFGRGFWTCAKGQCDFYSENEDGEPGVSFFGGFYPRLCGGKRKHCD